jgi:hypothetical protein
MDITQAITIAVTIVLGIASYIFRGVMHRIDRLEADVQHKVDEPQVRTIIKDKLDPLKEDVTEIKQMINQLLLKMNG